MSLEWQRDAHGVGHYAAPAVYPPSVRVALGGEEAFEIAADPASVSAGPLTFIAHNIGGFAHECLIVRTDLTAAEIVASVPPGGTLDESDLDIRADSGDVAAGGYVRFDVLLEPGHYVLLCNETGHVHLGMASDFEVVQLSGGSLADVASR